VNDETCSHRAMAGFLGVERGNQVVHDRHGSRAASACDDAGTRRRRIDVDAARTCERFHELADSILAAGLHDHVHRVFTLNDGLSLNLDAQLADIGAAQVVQDVRSGKRIRGRTPLRLVLVANDEERHPLGPFRFTFRRERPQDSRTRSKNHRSSSRSGSPVVP
jgi:hypothetical protein